MTPDQFVIITALTICSIGAITFEIVTALTIASIAAIIALYFVVLKRKGWLTEERPSETSYLCPNLQCRKIFQGPIILTDLSVAPPKEYLACPHCGLDLGTLQLKPQKSIVNDTVLRARLIEKDLSGNHQSLTQEAISGTTVQGTYVFKSEPIVRRAGAGGEVSKSFAARKDTLKEPPDSLGNSGEKRSIESLRKCSHFFGYVKTLPKNTSIPDECLWCPSIVECLSHEQKAKAEA